MTFPKSLHSGVGSARLSDAQYSIIIGPTEPNDLIVIVAIVRVADVEEGVPPKLAVPLGWDEAAHIAEPWGHKQVFFRRSTGQGSHSQAFGNPGSSAAGNVAFESVAYRNVDWGAGPFVKMEILDAAATRALGPALDGDAGTEPGDAPVASSSLVVLQQIAEADQDIPGDALSGFGVQRASVSFNMFFGMRARSWRSNIEAQTPDEGEYGYTISGDDDPEEPPWITPTIVQYTILGSPSPSPAFPAEPDPTNVRLRCAESYNAFITDITYRNILGDLEWTRLDWSRILDDVSSASVMVPDRGHPISCCIDYGGIDVWRFGLLIERNDQEVWSGPITEVSRLGESLRIGASDIFARLNRRVLRVNGLKRYDQVDEGVIFADIVNQWSRIASDPWFLRSPTVTTGASLSRDLRDQQLEMAWPVMRELVDSGIDAFVMNGRLYVWQPGEGWKYHTDRDRLLPGPYNVNGDMVLGTFTNESFQDRPDWSIAAANQGNSIFVPGADSGEMGFRQIVSAENAISQDGYGVLDMVEPSSLYRPADEEPDVFLASLQARANSLRDLRAVAPAVISGGVLDEGAPVDVEHLIPGAVWVLDIHDVCFPQLLQAGRLKAVNVDVIIDDGAIVEEIRPTIHPIGFEGSNLA